MASKKSGQQGKVSMTEKSGQQFAALTEKPGKISVSSNGSGMQGKVSVASNASGMQGKISVASNAPGVQGKISMAKGMVNDEGTLEVVGAGAGGVTEMTQYMSQDKVMWSLLRFEFGHGQFRRTKIIFLHFNGEDTPVILRGQANAMTKTVTHFLRGGGKDIFHASITLKELSEVTAETIMVSVSQYMIVDSINGGSTADMLAQYKEQVELERAAQQAKMREEEELARAEKAKRTERRRSFKAELMQSIAVDGEKAAADVVAKPTKVLMETIALEGLKQVGHGGAWNWVLVGPDVKKLPLIGGGSGGVKEMRECAEAHQDLVMYGLLRVTFSEGNGSKLHRFAMLQISGESVPTVKKGRFSALKPEMERRIKEHACLHATYSDLRPKDVTIETVLSKMGDAEKLLIQGGKNDVAKALHAIGRLQQYHKNLEDDKKKAPQKFVVRISEQTLERHMSEQTLKASRVASKENPGSDSEDSDCSSDEEEALAPHAGEKIEEVNRLIRVARECNWALIQPRNLQPQGQRSSSRR